MQSGARTLRVIIRGARCSRQRHETTNERDELVRALADALEVSAATSGQVAALSSYAESLLRWNARINLTAARIGRRRRSRSPSRRVRAGPEARRRGPTDRRRQRRRAAGDPARTPPAAADRRARRADRQEGGLPAHRDPRARPRWPGLGARRARRGDCGGRRRATRRRRSTSRSRARRWPPTKWLALGRRLMRAREAACSS